MLDMAFVREAPEIVKAAARNKGIEVDVDRLILLDNLRRDCLRKIEVLRAERNALSRTTADAPMEERRASNIRGGAIRRELASLEPELRSVEAEIRELMLRLPAIPTADTPIGASTDSNVEVRMWGAIPHFSFTPKDHVQIGRALDIMEIESAVAFAGARSYFLKGAGALLEQAVIRFARDWLIERGFLLLQVPLLVRDEAMTATGYFPLGRDEAFRVERDSLNLVGTSEVPLVSRWLNRTVCTSELPLRTCAVSPCFRREVGAAGRDTKGLYRVHHFMKVEQVVVSQPDEAVSRSLHEEILGNAEGIMQALELPYRIVSVCTGEMGQGQVRKHDIEGWMPSRNSYGETHSCSSFHDFQARRAGIRCSMEDGRPSRFAYTLNCTAVASPRILIPLLEVHQQADGTVRIPLALRKYMADRSLLTPPA